MSDAIIIRTVGRSDGRGRRGGENEQEEQMPMKEAPLSLDLFTATRRPNLDEGGRGATLSVQLNCLKNR